MHTRLLFYSYILNIFDLVATMSLVSQFGMEAEGNPIGQLLLSSPQAAVAFKVFGVAALLLLLYVFRNNKTAKIGTILIFTAYTLLTVYHVFIINAVNM